MFAGRMWVEEFIKEGAWNEDVVPVITGGRGDGKVIRSTRRSATAILRERPKYPEEEK